MFVGDLVWVSVVFEVGCCCFKVAVVLTCVGMVVV